VPVACGVSQLSALHGAIRCTCGKQLDSLLPSLVIALDLPALKAGPPGCKRGRPCRTRRPGPASGGVAYKPHNSWQWHSTVCTPYRVHLMHQVALGLQEALVSHSGGCWRARMTQPGCRRGTVGHCPG